MDQKSMHFLRIHAAVAKRLWSELTDRVSYAIARDENHESEEFRWFEEKVMRDATHLYEDPNYYRNDPFTFGHSQEEYLPTQIT